MSYEPTTWASGDVITSQKLNKIEQGISNTNNIAIINLDLLDCSLGSRTVYIVLCEQETHQNITAWVPKSTIETPSVIGGRQYIMMSPIKNIDDYTVILGLDYINEAYTNIETTGGATLSPFAVREYTNNSWSSGSIYSAFVITEDCKIIISDKTNS